MKKIVRFLKAFCVFIIICYAGLRILAHLSPDFYRVMRPIRDNITSKIYQMVYLQAIPSKFWAHRCDDTRKLKEMVGNYQGVELDIVFYPSMFGGDFDVSHDSKAAIEYPLESFFEILKSSQTTRIWLDFKNLDKRTKEASFHQIGALLNEHQITKERVIIESNNWSELGLFHRNGYYTSYYCPVDDEKYLNGAHEAEFSDLVMQAVLSGNVDAVSFPMEYYPLLRKLDIRVDFLTWDSGLQWWQFYRNELGRKIFEDEQVKVILVNAPSLYER